MSDNNDPTRPCSADKRCMSRREMLRRTGAAAITAGALTAGGFWLHDRTGKAGLQQPVPETLPNYFAKIDYPISATRMSVVRGTPSNLKEVEKMVRAALNELTDQGMKTFINNGDIVVLKPNIGFERSPRFGATTDPNVVIAVGKLCREAGASEIILTDNPIESAASCFSRSGMTKAAEVIDARVVLPAELDFEPLAIRPPNKDGSPHIPDPSKYEALGTWPVFWKPLRNATKIINIPAIKDHNLCYASMGLKNWYGLLGGRRNQFHQAIHNIISDLGLMVNPTLTIADGLRVLMKNGPTGGSLSDVKKGDCIVASVDQLACDAWCYENLLERDPATLRYLELSQDKFGGGENGDERFSETHRLSTMDWKGYLRRGLMKELTADLGAST